MPRFLSDEWIDQMHDAAVASAALTAAAPSDAPLVVQHVVSAGSDDDPSGAFHLVVASDGAAVVRGTSPDATVTFTQTYRTAADIAAGRRSAQAAFMAGELRIGGQVDRLMADHALLTGLDEVFAAVRARTEY
ncbi:MAG: SCP2 sterol-binding domain-containing protein [Acidimicrobiales bacterium]